MKVYGFPGQGSQFRGMGAELFDAFPVAVAQADQILQYSVRERCVNDPGDLLRLTQFTQPALYVVEALTYLKRQQEDAVPPDILVGHSLGEYVALFAAGAFSFETGLRLVNERGALMSRCQGGGMAAVVGCDLAVVETMLRFPALNGLDLASHNAPTQFVVAGPPDQLEYARNWLEVEGHGEFIPLDVSVPFHSRYMRPAADAFARCLDQHRLRSPECAVIANADALPYTAAKLKTSLVGQITSPVLWVNTVRYIMGLGDFTFEELGPGRTLTGLVKQIRRAEASRL